MHSSDLQAFYRTAGKLIPWLMGAALILFVVGFYFGFFECPIEARQGNSYRIIFIHVSAAWLSMLLYVLMAVFSLIGLLRNNQLAFIVAQAMAPTGALMGFIALFSDPLLPLPRVHCAAQRDRRQAPRGPRRLRHLDRRRRQRPDHLLLGALVEHAPPGRLDHDVGHLDGEDHALHAPRHGGGGHVLRHGHRALAHPHDHP